jgi:hypothetical protein
MKPALKDQIIKDVESLSEDKQLQVATFIKALKNSAAPKNMTGKEAIQLFGGTLDEKSANEMLKIVEEGCEIVDAEGW